MFYEMNKRKFNHSPAHPPRWARHFLEWYCKPELLEDLQGDLNEYFQRNLKTKGRRKARIIYILDVFKFLRPYTLNKPDFLKYLINWIMIGSYVKTSGRNIARNKLFSVINITGLAISMAVGLLLISFLHDLHSYDQFNVKKNRIYRVIEDYKTEDKETQSFASTSREAGNEINATIPGIEDMVIMKKFYNGNYQIDDRSFPITGFWSESSLFNIFSFPMLEGNPKTALREPYSVVLTETTARKLFGNADPMGKMVVFKKNYANPKDQSYLVTGVLKDIPRFSHMHFDALCSFSSLNTILNDNPDERKWGHTWDTYVYLLLPENGNINAVRKGLNRLSSFENSMIPGHKFEMNLRLQSLNKIETGENLGNQIEPIMPAGTIWFIFGLVFVVLLSACFNYANLSIARSFRRMHEVGIRKIIGAQKNQVLMQFMAESIIISLFALVIAISIFLFLRPTILSLSGEIKGLVTMRLSFGIIVYFISFALLLGFLAGFLPALYYSRINVLKVMKSSSSVKVFRFINMRKALITTQYTFSLIFITTTIISYSQYRNFISFDLGFNSDHVLNIYLQGNKEDIVRAELSKIPEITGLSACTMITGTGGYYDTYVKYKDPMDSAQTAYNETDENYIPNLQHKLIAGENFVVSPGNALNRSVIVNEQLLKRLNIAKGNPDKAIGEVVTENGNDLTIVGVVKDFQYGAVVQNKIGPFMFRYSKKHLRFINARIHSDNLPFTLARIKKAWKKIDPYHPLDADFYNDEIKEYYEIALSVIKIIGISAVVAITISALGLFGMVVFSTETKKKEIGIRKVMGAGINNLVFMMGKNFMVLLVISAVIAIPVTYLFFTQVILPLLVYHAPISILDLFSGTVAVVSIALIMIGSRTFKVAQTNPSEVLRNE